MFSFVSILTANLFLYMIQGYHKRLIYILHSQIHKQPQNILYKYTEHSYYTRNLCIYIYSQNNNNKNKIILIIIIIKKIVQ